MHEHRYDALLEAISDEVEDLGPWTKGERHASTLEQRARDLQPGEPGRAEWFMHAGERWELGRDRARARSCYEAALADGGPAWIDPRAALISVLLDLGDSTRADELLAELRRDLAAHGPRGPVHDYVGEALEEHDRLEEALRWFGAGLSSAERSDPDTDELGCLNGRFRVRRRLGLAHDRYDVLCEQRRRESRARLEQDLLDHDLDDGRPPALTALHWPDSELAKVVTRWPATRDDYGADHAEHRGHVERHLRELATHGLPVSIGDGSLEEYVEFAERHDRDPAEPSARAAYAAHLGLLGRNRAWPPGRNDPCWCGSGAKYEKCCGALRFP
jgi:hypothetical protein